MTDNGGSVRASKSPSRAVTVLASVDFLRDLPEADLEDIARHTVQFSLPRGAILIRQGDGADRLFIVLSGRCLVHVAGRDDPVSEIGAGQPVGEVGFFGGGTRTATVSAARDTIVLALDRPAFARIAQRSPKIYESILGFLARRLAATTASMPSKSAPAHGRSIAIIGAGGAPLSAAFAERLSRLVAPMPRTLSLTRQIIERRFPGLGFDDPDICQWLNRRETGHDLILFIAGSTLTPWSHRALVQADQVLVVAEGMAQPVSELETLAFSIHAPRQRRLVLLHPARSGWVQGTTAWLQGRDVLMHHHVALQDDADIASLLRFLHGRARGFVASGGGALGLAHVGLFKAFAERGIDFDILGGTSVGAAMMAGFAMLLVPEILDAAVHDIFVHGRGFRKPTWPRYALLDHLAFDAALQRHYRGLDIENLWKPYFALATDLSQNEAVVLRAGPVWQAVRASASLPGVLPPMFPGDGRMLVDGGVSDNIPLRAMQKLKTGPNLVVHFGLSGDERFNVDYAKIPGRNALLARLINPFSRQQWPDAPGPISILQRSMMAGQSLERIPFGPLDLVLRPQLPAWVNFMGFHQHREIFDSAHAWGLETIDRLAEGGDKALAALMRD